MKILATRCALVDPPLFQLILRRAEGGAGRWGLPGSQPVLIDFVVHFPEETFVVSAEFGQVGDQTLGTVVAVVEISFERTRGRGSIEN